MLRLETAKCWRKTRLGLVWLLAPSPAWAPGRQLRGRARGGRGACWYEASPHLTPRGVVNHLSSPCEAHVGMAAHMSIWCIPCWYGVSHVGMAHHMSVHRIERRIRNRPCAVLGFHGRHMRWQHWCIPHGLPSSSFSDLIHLPLLCTLLPLALLHFSTLSTPWPFLLQHPRPRLVFFCHGYCQLKLAMAHKKFEYISSFTSAPCTTAMWSCHPNLFFTCSLSSLLLTSSSHVHSPHCSSTHLHMWTFLNYPHLCFTYAGASGIRAWS